MIARDMPEEERFWAKVRKTSECWEWSGSRTAAGYGNVRLPNGKNGYAHRISYRFLRGGIPDGLVIDHLCRNRACVNPAHLEPVTHAENVRRGAAPYGPVRDKCRHGHDITIPENVYTLPGGNHRCRLCAKTHESRRAEARHERGDLRKILKSHCIRGHEFDEANTHVTRGGHRVCRKCSYIRLKSYREKKRAS